MTDRDELREHSFDGIQEYDNDLPQWWVWLFWITIVFAVVYPFIYDFGPGQFASETVDQEVAAVKAQQSGSTTATESSAGDILTLAADSKFVAQGAQIFQSRCVACHGPQAQGLIGPNLTDDYWIHGGKISEIVAVIENGVLAKGMLAWKGQLSGTEIQQVTAYIWSLHGSNPPNPKEPQGDKVARE